MFILLLFLNTPLCLLLLLISFPATLPFTFLLSMDVNLLLAVSVFFLLLSSPLPLLLSLSLPLLLPSSVLVLPWPLLSFIPEFREASPIAALIFPSQPATVLPPHVLPDLPSSVLVL